MNQQTLDDGYTQPANTTNQINLPYYNEISLPSGSRKYNGAVAKTFGFIQMAIGVVCFIFNAVHYGINIPNFNFYIIGYGIWTGVIFFVAGLLSFLSGKKQSKKCLIISTMVMNNIAACFSLVCLIFCIFDVLISFGIKKMRGHTYYYYNSTPKLEESTSFDLNISLPAIMALLSLLEAVISITGSAFCCRVVCCTGTPPVIGIPYYSMANLPAMYIPNNTDPYPDQNRPSGNFNFTPVRDEDSQNQISQMSELPSTPPSTYDRLRL